MKNADKPAMPVLTYEDYECSDGLPAGYSVTKQRVVSHGGLTKREMFAMHAMQVLLSDASYADLYNSADEWRKNVSEASVEFADALLAELDK